jgi:hypothetical protein
LDKLAFWACSATDGIGEESITFQVKESGPFLNDLATNQAERAVLMVEK